MKLEAIRSELEDCVLAQMEDQQVPGVVVGVLHGAEELVAAFGVTNIDHPLEVTDETLFQIGSTTKTFTATALMRMVDDGRLDLDAPLQKYLPDFSLANEEWARRVTPKHLLTHTGGWEGDYLSIHPVGGRGRDALARAIEAMPRVPLLTPPGTLFFYNSVGFSVAGRLLEVLTGQRYERALRELVLAPLGLGSSYFLPEEVITRRLAVGHVHRSSGEIQVARAWGGQRCNWAAGGLSSNVHDQLRYARFHLGDGKTSGGERLLHPASMARMQSPQVEVGDCGEAFGISWMLDRLRGTKTVGHGGRAAGQVAAFGMIPERGFALVVLTNADTGYVLRESVLRWVHERVLGLVPEEPELVELPGEVLKEYVGTYQGELQSLEIRPGETDLELHVRDQVLDRWDPPAQLPPTPIGFAAPDRLIQLAGRSKGFPATFIRGDDGTIQWLRWGGRHHRRLETTAS